MSPPVGVGRRTRHRRRGPNTMAMTMMHIVPLAIMITQITLVAASGLKPEDLCDLKTGDLVVLTYKQKKKSVTPKEKVYAFEKVDDKTGKNLIFLHTHTEFPLDNKKITFSIFLRKKNIVPPLQVVKSGQRSSVCRKDEGFGNENSDWCDFLITSTIFGKSRVQANKILWDQGIRHKNGLISEPQKDSKPSPKKGKKGARSRRAQSMIAIPSAPKEDAPYELSSNTNNARPPRRKLSRRVSDLVKRTFYKKPNEMEQGLLANADNI